MIMVLDILRNWCKHFLNHVSELELVVWGLYIYLLLFDVVTLYSIHAGSCDNTVLQDIHPRESRRESWAAETKSDEM
jgi:hypothetical protein